MRKLDYPSADAESWRSVDAPFAGLFAPDDDVLTSCLSANTTAGLPAHDVSALQGQLLALLVQVTGAERVLEIGTLGAYSTIRMARVLPPRGMIVTIEANVRHAAVARDNIVRSSLSDRIDIQNGRALDVLPTLSGPFDLIFIDADKPNNPAYLREALRLARVGTLIIGDNVVRGGAVVDADSPDPSVQGVCAFLDAIAAEPRLTATAIQTVGEKGWDGFVLARVT